MMRTEGNGEPPDTIEWDRPYSLKGDYNKFKKEKKENQMKNLKDFGLACAICAVIGILVGTVGCEVSAKDSGKRYSAAINKMSVPEIIMHNRIDSQWRAVREYDSNFGTSDIMYFARKAVRSRSQKPAASAIPFCDISETIQSINNTAMPSFVSDNATRELKTLQAIDPKWYKQLVEECAEVTIEEEILPVIEVIELSVVKDLVANNTPAPDSSIVVIEEVEILPLEEMKALREEIIGCELAKGHVLELINTNGYLTVLDRNEVRKRVTKCGYMLLQHELNFGTPEVSPNG